MENLKTLLGKVQQCSSPVQLKDFIRKTGKEYGIYPDSVYEKDGSVLFLIREQSGKTLIVLGESKLFDAFTGMVSELSGIKCKTCEMNHANAVILRKNLPFTAPVAHQGTDITIGLGDRLGLASPGHLRLVKGLKLIPVLAQQSIRELNLTGRTYDDVLDAASWAVFQEGYESGFSADGDHLKTYEEVKYALDSGFTMITLDCSQQIDNSIPSLSDAEVESRYAALPSDYTSRMEARYLEKSFTLPDGSVIEFKKDDFKQIILIYSKAISYTIGLYKDLLANYTRTIDFEMSIDETLTPTSPQSHFFVASELINGGVKVVSLAPRFCGEFQKGIDYIGDIAQFEKEFIIHAEIARYFNYKLSIHSGSDKFSVFPIIGRKTNGKYHLKTAGTNWLEAIRVLARKDPDLYREIHKFAVANLEEAKKYYHIGADLARVPDVDKLRDSELPELMNQDDSRQVIHITYGLILQAKDKNGNPLFKDRIYNLLHQYEEEYYKVLYTHIGKHLKGVGILA